MTRRILTASLLGLATIAAHAAPPQLAGGGSHSIAVGTDGLVRTWGSDNSGELGSGRTLSFPTPLAVPGLNGVRALSGGYGHTMGLRSDGTLLVVGDNLFQQLGDGTTTSSTVPIPVMGVSNVTAIEAGTYASYAVRADGSVLAWGYNDEGQLGDGTLSSRNRPVALTGITGVTALSAGDAHALALRNDGTVWSWGGNAKGQLGDGTPTRRTTPAPVPGISDAIGIAAGDEHSCAVKRDGTVLCWGVNFWGQIGNGTRTDVPTPTAVAGLTGVTALSAGGGYTLALKADGTVWGWGSNLFEELADGGVLIQSATPVRINGLANITSISAGYAHAIARRSDGAAFTWGDNDRAQLGLGDTNTRTTVTQLPSLAGVAHVAAGRYHTHLALADGRVFGWGSNTEGQLGIGLAVYRTIPEVVAGLANVVAVGAAYSSSFAVRSDGTVWSWGGNTLGVLGSGATGNRSTPGQVGDIGGVVAIAGGFNHVLVVRGDGAVYGWGSNFDGELSASGPGLFGSFPRQVLGIPAATAVACGLAHSLVLGTDGRVYTFGFNAYGQLGTGGTASRATPQAVPGLTDVVAIGAGDYHSMAVTRDGRVFAWGGNLSGQLGDGTVTDRPLPVQTLGLTDAVAVAGAYQNSFALRRDGTLVSWGGNGFGVLGYGSNDGRRLPGAVPGLGAVSSVAGGLFHALAVRTDGSVFAWGSNNDGRLGDGTVIDRYTPVTVRRDGGAGTIAGNDWFLDLVPAVPSSIPADKVPVFLVVARPVNADVQATVQYRAQDLGSTASTFVFALAPQDSVRATADGSEPFKVGKALTRDGRKETAVACVLAQLNASGQLQAVSASSLQAFVTGVLTSQGQAVTVINGATAVNIGGATFYVGYGPNATSMLNSGTNRGVVSIAGPKECKPSAPQTGWWWNKNEGGRGYSIEVQGNKIFYAAFLYDDAGRSNWFVATGITSLDGSLFTGDLLRVANGQSLGGAYRAPTAAQSVGPFTLAFNDAKNGTMVWPGGTVAIERFDIVPNGLAAAPRPNQPETGWWWNPAESGRGFFIEWQDGVADLAGYMYDDAGNAVWYLSVQQTPNIQAFSGSWWLYANGQSLTGAYRPATRINDNVAPVTITFTSATTATMTLPNGRTTALQRHRF